LDSWSFLLDENMPKRADSTLRAMGYPVARAIEVGLRAQPDSFILAFARVRKLIIVTQDSDFLQFTPPHAGILFLDFPSATTSTSALINALTAALGLLIDQDLTDSTYMIDPDGLQRII